MLDASTRSSRVRSLSTLALVSTVPLLGGLACSASRATGTLARGDDAIEEDTTTGTNGASGQGGSGGGKERGGGEGGGFAVGTSVSGQSGEVVCAQATAEARLTPLTMFVAVDQSGSMISDGKWESVKSAFAQFFLAPEAGGIGVALRFWPDPRDFSDPNPPLACNDAVDFNCGPAVVAACEVPEVDVGLLPDPGHAQALIDAFDAHSPDGSTPTSAALDGATKWAAKYIFAHDHAEQAIVLLVTDGEPTTCDTDPAAINGIAAKALSGAGVLTFAVGLAGSNQATMDAIAQAGGTGQAFMIQSGTAAQELLAALRQIQASAVSCSLPLPAPPDPGDEIDPAQVDVALTPSGGGAESKLPRVALAGACGAVGGWYYEDEAQPTTIHLCPASCAEVQIDGGARIDLFLGCIKKGPA